MCGLIIGEDTGRKLVSVNSSPRILSLLHSVFAGGGGGRRERWPSLFYARDLASKQNKTKVNQKRARAPANTHNPPHTHNTTQTHKRLHYATRASAVTTSHANLNSVQAR